MKRYKIRGQKSRKIFRARRKGKNQKKNTGETIEMRKMKRFQRREKAGTEKRGRKF